MNTARKLLYSIPIALVALATFLVALPAGAAVTGVMTLAPSKWVSYQTTVACPTCANTFTISVDDLDAGTSAPGTGNSGAIDTLNVTIKSTTSPTAFTLVLTETGNATGIFNTVVVGAVNVINSGVSSTGTIGPAATASNINTSEGDTITVLYTDTTSPFGTQEVSKTLTVDATNPTITSIGPANKSTFGGTSVTLSATASDNRSGFVPDDVATAGNDVLFLSNGTTLRNQVVFSLAPTIAANVDTVLLTAMTNVNSTLTGTVDAAGVLSASAAAQLSAGLYSWSVTVQDRSGNVAVLDSDSSTVAVNRARVTLDNTGPALVTAKTGQKFDEATQKLGQNRSWIQVDFTEAGALDPATVSASDFTVDNVVPNSASMFPTGPGPDLISGNGDDISMPVSVFLVVPAALAPNAAPVVRLVGTVSDKAGNTNTTTVLNVTAADGIEPGLTMTIVGDIASRDASKTTATVTIASDEPLSAPPSVKVGTFTVNGFTATAVDALAVNETSLVGSLVAGQTQQWTVTVVPTSGNGLYNIRATGTDVASTPNTGKVGTGGGAGCSAATVLAAVNSTATTGCGSPTTLGAAFVLGSTTPTSTVDVSKAKTLEFDAQFGAGQTTAAFVAVAPGGTNGFVLSPQSSAVTQTDSVRPFVQIDFSAEAKEYKIGTLDTVAANTVSNSGSSTFQVDSHKKVTLTKATFGASGTTAVDVLANVQVTGDNTFLFLPSADLTVGTSYVLTVDVKDELGTATTGFALTLTVVAPKSVSINMVPGWNLISFPDNPSKMAIADVFGANAGIDQVLTYDVNDPTGPWLISQRSAAGVLSNAQIVNVDALHAYWVHANTFETVKVIIPRRTASTSGSGLQPPQISIKKGWNLVPVIDTAISSIGTLVDADVYFGTLTQPTGAGNAWQFAYTFDPSTTTWIRRTTAGGFPATAAAVDALQVGKGYWLFTSADGLLVP